MYSTTLKEPVTGSKRPRSNLRRVPDLLVATAHSDIKLGLGLAQQGLALELAIHEVTADKPTGRSVFQGHKTLPYLLQRSRELELRATTPFNRKPIGHDAILLN